MQVSEKGYLSESITQLNTLSIFDHLTSEYMKMICFVLFPDEETLRNPIYTSKDFSFYPFLLLFLISEHVLYISYDLQKSDSHDKLNASSSAMTTSSFPFIAVMSSVFLLLLYISPKCLKTLH